MMSSSKLVKGLYFAPSAARDLLSHGKPMKKTRSQAFLMILHICHGR